MTFDEFRAEVLAKVSIFRRSRLTWDHQQEVIEALNMDISALDFNKQQEIDRQQKEIDRLNKYIDSVDECLDEHERAAVAKYISSLSDEVG